MTITDQLRVVIEAEVERAVRDMGKWDAVVGETEKKLDKLEKAADKMANKLMLVSGGITAAGVASVKFAADVETQKVALEVLTGSAEVASEVFSDLQTLSAKTPLSMEDINAAATQLLNFGTATEDVAGTIRMLGDAAQGNAAKLDTVVRAFGRMQMKGKASMEELNMLTEAGVPILDQLSKSLGVTTEELFKMASTGRVSFGDIQAAFISLTSEGGRLNGMMERQSATLNGKLSTALDNLKISAAKVAESVVPIIKNILDGISVAAESFARMDDGSKKALISLLAIGAAAGPIAKTGAAAVGLVKAISGLASTNPAVLGIMAVVAALSLLAGAFVSAKLNAQSFSESLQAVKDSQKSALAAAKSYEEVRAVLPAMTRAMYDAAKATGQFDKAISETGKLQSLRDELSKLQKDVAGKSDLMEAELGKLVMVLEKPIDPSASSWVDGMASAADKLAAVQDMIEHGIGGNMRKVVRESAAFKAAFDAKNFEGMLAVVKSMDAATPEMKRRMEALRAEIERIGSGATIVPNVVPPPAAAARKTWQDWWQEITGVDQGTFRTGAEAARRYLDGVGSELGYAQAIGTALGERIDPIPYLEKEQESIKKSLIELLAIDPSDIVKGDAFQFGFEYDESGNAKMDASVKALVDRYEELSRAIHRAKSERDKLSESETLAKRAADMIKAIETPLDRYKRELAEIDEIWRKQEFEGQLLTEEQLLGLTAAAADRYRAALDAIEKKKEDLRNIGFEEWLEDVATKLYKNWGASEDLAAAFAKLTVQMTSMVVSGIVDTFSSLAETWAEGADSADDYKRILAEQAAELMKQLPLLMVQAGLSLLANPATRALGIGLIFGGIGSSLIAGAAQGYANRLKNEKEEEDKAVANAKGNIFSSGAIVPFAKGGAFTNGIVTRTTRFNIGEMGEKGPEAVVPLARMTDGSLGVASSGAGTQIVPVTNVYVQNYSGEPVETKERSIGGIREIEVIVGAIVDKNLSEGRHDRALAGRDLRRRGVRG